MAGLDDFHLVVSAWLGANHQRAFFASGNSDDHRGRGRIAFWHCYGPSLEDVDGSPNGMGYGGLVWHPAVGGAAYKLHSLHRWAVSQICVAAPSAADTDTVIASDLRYGQATTDLLDCPVFLSVVELPVPHLSRGCTKESARALPSSSSIRACGDVSAGSLASL